MGLSRSHCERPKENARRRTETPRDYSEWISQAAFEIGISNCEAAGKVLSRIPASVADNILIVLEIVFEPEESSVGAAVGRVYRIKPSASESTDQRASSPRGRKDGGIEEPRGEGNQEP